MKEWIEVLDARQLPAIRKPLEAEIERMIDGAHEIAEQAAAQERERLRKAALDLSIGWQPGAEPADYLRRGDVLMLFGSDHAD